MDFLKNFFRNENFFKVMVIVYIVLYSLTELIGLYFGTLVGLLSSTVFFLILLNHYFFTKDKTNYKSLLVIEILPMVRILSYALPLNDFPGYLWHLILGIPIGVLLVLAGRMSIFPWRNWKLDIKPYFSDLRYIIVGIPLSLAFFFLQRPQDQGTESNLILLLVAAVILFVFSAIIEEALFRGLIYDTLFEIFDYRADIAVSVLYASMFISSASWPVVIMMGLTGWFFSFLVYRTDSLWTSILTNGLLKIGWLLVWPSIILIVDLVA